MECSLRLCEKKWRTRKTISTAAAAAGATIFVFSAKSHQKKKKRREGMCSGSTCTSPQQAFYIITYISTSFFSFPLQAARQRLYKKRVEIRSRLLFSRKKCKCLVFSLFSSSSSSELRPEKQHEKVFTPIFSLLHLLVYYFPGLMHTHTVTWRKKVYEKT